MLPALATAALAGGPARTLLAGGWAVGRQLCGSRLGRRGYAAGDASEGGGVLEVQSAADYDRLMNHIKDTNSVCIIDFTAKWCGPCKAIAPVYEQLAKQYPQVAFLKLDIDNESLAGVVQDHGITGVPTFSMYKGPRKVEHFTGARLDVLKAVLQKHGAPSG